jgi:hypothetical protein
MNKLRLTLEDLRIDSFDTTSPAPRKGTVVAQQDCTCVTCATVCDNTCPNWETCGLSCYYTCQETCDDPSCDVTCQDTCGPSCGGTCRQYTCRCQQYP